MCCGPPVRVSLLSSVSLQNIPLYVTFHTSAAPPLKPCLWRLLALPRRLSRILSYFARSVSRSSRRNLSHVFGVFRHVRGSLPQNATRLSKVKGCVARP